MLFIKNQVIGHLICAWHCAFGIGFAKMIKITLVLR